MLLKTSAAWYTRLRAVAPQFGADDRAKLRTFSSSPMVALKPRCAIGTRPLRMNTNKIMNGYGKRTVKEADEPRVAHVHPRGSQCFPVHPRRSNDWCWIRSQRTVFWGSRVPGYRQSGSTLPSRPEMAEEGWNFSSNVRF